MKEADLYMHLVFFFVFGPFGLFIFFLPFFIISSDVLLSAACLCLCFEWLGSGEGWGSRWLGMAPHFSELPFSVPLCVVVELYSEGTYGFR